MTQTEWSYLFLMDLVLALANSLKIPFTCLQELRVASRWQNRSASILMDLRPVKNIHPHLSSSHASPQIHRSTCWEAHS